MSTNEEEELEELKKWDDFFIAIDRGEIAKVKMLFEANRSLFLNFAYPHYTPTWGWGPYVGWSVVCWAAACNKKEVIRYLIDECKFDIHFINQSPHTDPTHDNRNFERYRGASVLHFVADDPWRVFEDNEEAQFEMLFSLISDYHVDEEITTADQHRNHHTYREFLALLPSRSWNSNRKQKYANRLTNYESYYRSPIKRWTHKYSVILQHLPFDDDGVMLSSQPRKIQK